MKFKELKNKVKNTFFKFYRDENNNKFDFRNLFSDDKWKHFCSLTGYGDRFLKTVLIPCLKYSKTYKRATGYFTPYVIAKMGEGVIELLKNNGEMYLILGAHDIPEEVRLAEKILLKEEAKKVLEHIGNKIAENFDNFIDVYNKNNIECLAWLLKNERLHIRVAMPKKTKLNRGSGIFHEKRLLFYDFHNNVIAGTGSGNETTSGLTDNGENWDIYFSWINFIEEYVKQKERIFEKIWQGKHIDYFTYNLPDAIKEKLWEYYKNSKEIIGNSKKKMNNSFRKKLADVAYILKNIKDHPAFWQFGLGPIKLYPHQKFVADEALKKYPIRKILGDEVGLGKTLETGAIIKRLNQLGLAERILILTPGGLSKQWIDEMKYKFSMDFKTYNSTEKKLETNRKNYIECDNPFNLPDENLIICSWHYTRLKKNRDKLLKSQHPFDLVAIDEAHSARKRKNKPPTLLYSLLEKISIKIPNILLVTATPMQMDPKEIFDLLKILGLRGEYWGKESNFKEFYDKLSVPSNMSRNSFKNIIDAIKNESKQYLSNSEKRTIINNIDDINIKNYFLKILIEHKDSLEDFIKLSANPKSYYKAIKEILPYFSPVYWYMIRNMRNELHKLNPKLYSFPKRKNKHIPIKTNDKNFKSIRRIIRKYIKKTIPILPNKIGRSHTIIGFLKTIYWQRFCSSLFAFYKTLTKRRNNLRQIINLTKKAKKSEVFDIDWEKLISESEFKILDESKLNSSLYTIDLNSKFYNKILDKIRQELMESGNSSIIEYVKNEEKILSNILKKIRPYYENPLKDPKINTTIKRIKRSLNENNKVLIFSRYTDTLIALLKSLKVDNTLLSNNFGLFTGDESCYFIDEKFAEKENVSKDTLSNKLEKGDIKILICSDAASEGFNLQAASAVINIDVPWNPSKLEQRIGRADRLGHNPNIPVLVEYIWYKEQDMLEKRMYKKLLKRQDLKRIIVGPAQELVNKEIKNMIIKDDIRSNEDIENTIRQIDKLKKDNYQLYELMEKGSHNYGQHFMHSIENRFEVCLKKFIEDTCKELNIDYIKKNDSFKIKHMNIKEGSFKMGKSNYLSLVHPINKYLINEIMHDYYNFSNIFKKKKIISGKAILEILENKLDIQNDNVIDEKSKYNNINYKESLAKHHDSIIEDLKRDTYIKLWEISVYYLMKNEIKNKEVLDNLIELIKKEEIIKITESIKVFVFDNSKNIKKYFKKHDGITATNLYHRYDGKLTHGILSKWINDNFDCVTNNLQKIKIIRKNKQTYLQRISELQRILKKAYLNLK